MFIVYQRPLWSQNFDTKERDTYSAYWNRKDAVLLDLSGTASVAAIRRGVDREINDRFWELRFGRFEVVSKGNEKPKTACYDFADVLSSAQNGPPNGTDSATQKLLDLSVDLSEQCSEEIKKSWDQGFKK